MNTYLRLGDLLVQQGIITRLELAAAIAAQHGSRHRLGQILVARGYATETDIARCLAQQLGVPLADPASLRPTAAAQEKLPYEVALHRSVLPISVDDDTFECAVADPMDVEATDHISRLVQRRIRLQVAPESTLREAIERCYGRKAGAKPLADPSAPKRYAELSRQGSDGPASWFAATDTGLGRPVTLASIRVASDRHEDVLATTQWAARITHPMVCHIYDTGTHRQRRWTAMEAVHGESLADISRRGANRWGLEILSPIADLAELLSEQPCGRLCPSNLIIRGSTMKVAPVTARPGTSDGEAIGEILAAAARCAGTYGDWITALGQRCRPTAHDAFRNLQEAAGAIRQLERANRLGDNTTDERNMLFVVDGGLDAEPGGLLRRIQKMIGRAA